MCLGIPGRVANVVEEQGLLMGDVDFGGVKRRVCLAYVPEAGIDDYVNEQDVIDCAKVYARTALALMHR